MEHLPLDIICKIADGDIAKKEMDLYSIHWNSCRSCRQEIELQQSILKVSREGKLVNPSDSFTQGILDVLSPSRKKRRHKWLLHNMGNIIAMTLVLTFLGYIFTITDTGSLQNDKTSKPTPVTEFVKIIQEGSLKLNGYLTPKLNIQYSDTSHTNTIVFAMLAIIMLIFIDRIAGHFFRRLRA